MLQTFSAAPYVLGQAYIDQLLALETAAAIDDALTTPPSEGS